MQYAKTLKSLSLEHFNKPGSWLIGTTLTVLLLIWNWQLVLAVGSGLLIMLLVYWLQQWRSPALQRLWQQLWQRLWNRANRQLSLAAVSGGITALGIYAASMIWTYAQDRWLATGMILQGLGTLSVLALLVRQSTQTATDPAQPHAQPNINSTFADLAHPDPVRRLIAVRTATHWATHRQSAKQDATQYAKQDVKQDAADLGLMNPMQLAECFRLMLHQETEPTLRSALVEGVEALTPHRKLTAGRRPSVSMSTRLQQPVDRVTQPARSQQPSH